ncbi:Uncharacterised protein [Mycobacterium tuberculosis]|nr:Uncharacterised protein [Mycobacterium tuberculosis]
MLNGSIFRYRLGILVVVILTFLTEIGMFKQLGQENNLGSLLSSLTY